MPNLKTQNFYGGKNVLTFSYYLYLVSFKMFKVFDRTYFLKILPSLCKSTAKGHIFTFSFLERAMISYIIHTQDYINQGPIKKENTQEVS